MPANVESMFSVRQMPWHQEGEILDDYPGTWAEARVLAGLDWDPVTTYVYVSDGINPDGTPHYEPIEGWKSISRSDTGAVLSLNKDTYTVIGHGEMGEIVEAVLAQPNVKWETAGVLDGGRAVWCLALLDEPITLPGDASPTLPYLAITNRHDGTGARTEMRRYTELAQQLLGIPITSKQRELFVTEFIPMPPQGLITDRVARNVEEARQALRLIFESKTTEQVAGSAYGLMQAAGEYLDHVRTARSWETRLNRTLIRPEPLKHRALSLIREVAAAA